MISACMGRQQHRKKREGVQPIERILDRLLRAHRVKDRVDRESIYRRWSEIVGEDMAQRTRVVDLTAGWLVVEVDSAPLLHELATYYREEILESIRKADGFPVVTDLRFRAGTFE